MRTLSLAPDIVRNRLRRRSRPRYLTHIVTFQCNARCEMCDSWKKPYADQLDFDGIDAVYAKLPEMDAVRLTGGEPFVRTDFPRIAEAAVSRLKPRFLHVTTNGFLTDRIVNFVRNRDPAVPLMMLVSIDGTRERHNKIRGHAAAYDKAMATVKTLAGMREEHNMSLSVNQVIVDEESIADHAALRQKLKSIGVDVFVVFAYADSATYNVRDEHVVDHTDGAGFDALADVPVETLAPFLDDLEAQTAQVSFSERIAKRYYYDGIRARLLDGSRSPAPPCVALNAHMRLYPNGGVPVCQSNSRIVGNLAKDDFDTVWYSDDAVEARDWVNKCDGCWAECEQTPNAIYTGDLLRHTVRRAVGA